MNTITVTIPRPDGVWASGDKLAVELSYGSARKFIAAYCVIRDASQPAETIWGLPAFHWLGAEADPS